MADGEAEILEKLKRASLKDVANNYYELSLSSKIDLLVHMFHSNREWFSLSTKMDNNVYMGRIVALTIDSVAEQDIAFVTVNQRKRSVDRVVQTPDVTYSSIFEDEFEGDESRIALDEEGYDPDLINVKDYFAHFLKGAIYSIVNRDKKWQDYAG